MRLRGNPGRQPGEATRGQAMRLGGWIWWGGWCLIRVCRGVPRGLFVLHATDLSLPRSNLPEEHDDERIHPRVCEQAVRHGVSSSSDRAA